MCPVRSVTYVPGLYPLEPTRRLCLLDLQQRARPFAICPLDGERERADTDLDTSPSALSRSPTKMNGSKGNALGGVQGQRPWSGSGVKTPVLSQFKRLPWGTDHGLLPQLPEGSTNLRSMRGLRSPAPSFPRSQP